jgi:NAD(P)-dependent dehydrogenase (short-subunit alcohol dehydrogenase family)
VTDNEDMPAGRFAGQVVVVAGAGSGIGTASATRLAREGASVVVGDLDADRGVLGQVISVDGGATMR